MDLIVGWGKVVGFIFIFFFGFIGLLLVSKFGMKKRVYELFNDWFVVFLRL